MTAVSSQNKWDGTAPVPPRRNDNCASRRNPVDCLVQDFPRVRSLVLLGFSLFLTANAGAATIAGKEAKIGSMVEIQFPVSTYFQNIAAQGGNPRPTMGRAVLSFPPGFDPARRWPILIVTSTTDFHTTSPMDAPAYKAPAD